MSNGELFGTLIKGINPKVLTVGPVAGFSHRYGIPINFTSISDAMAYVPLLDPDIGNPATDQWTILVTPGYYREVIRFKPFVNVVGLLKEAVVIDGAGTKDTGPLGSQVYLCSRSLLSNVTLGIPPESKQGEFVVRGYDVHTYSSGQHVGNVHFLGLSNVDFFCFRNPTDPKPAGGLIKFDGDWRTVIFRDVGGNYEAPGDYGIELIGRMQNADCHFINCFFDALFLEDEGGLIHVKNCIEVHLRNSLVRVNHLHRGLTTPITAVKTEGTLDSTGEQGTIILIEGSSLYGPGSSVLDVGPNTTCFFRHSFTDSKNGPGVFKASGPEGVGDA